MPLTDPPTLLNLEIIITNLLGVLARLAGIAAFIMLIVGGFQYLTSTGDPKKTEMAGKTIGAAIAGLAIIIIGWMALKLIQEITGVNLTHFTLKLGS